MVVNIVFSVVIFLIFCVAAGQLISKGWVNLAGMLVGGFLLQASPLILTSVFDVSAGGKGLSQWFFPIMYLGRVGSVIVAVAILLLAFRVSAKAAVSAETGAQR